MKDNKFLMVTIFILSIAIFAGSILISNSINSRGQIINKGLITEDEAAEYLSLTNDDFNDLVSTLEIQRAKLTSYDAYEFINFIEIDETKYFNKKQLDEWIEYNMINRIDINTFKAQ